MGEGHFDFNRIMREDHYKCALLQKGKQFLGDLRACSPSVVKLLEKS